jgi:hypothetical protein
MSRVSFHVFHRGLDSPIKSGNDIQIRRIDAQTLAACLFLYPVRDKLLRPVLRCIDSNIHRKRA